MFLACSSASSRVLRHLDAAALAAASGVNLRLDHDAACALGKELARHCSRFFERVGHLALGYGNAVLRQDLFCLILVDFHGWDRPVRCCLRDSAPHRVNLDQARPCQRYLKYYLAPQRTGKPFGAHLSQNAEEGGSVLMTIA